MLKDLWKTHYEKWVTEMLDFEMRRNEHHPVSQSHIFKAGFDCAIRTIKSEFEKSTGTIRHISEKQKDHDNKSG